MPMLYVRQSARYGRGQSPPPPPPMSVALYLSVSSEKQKEVLDVGYILMFNWTNEGEELRWGINYRWDKYSLFLVYLMFPFWILGIKFYRSCVGEVIYQGKTAEVLRLRFRIRNPWCFLGDATVTRWWQVWKFFLFGCNIYERAWRWKKLVMTREEMEDGVGFSGTDGREFWDSVMCQA